MAKNDVTWQRPEFEEALKDWRLVDHVCAGERAVKGQKAEYLPKPNPNDNTSEADKRFNQYLKRAVFYPLTGRTNRGLVSLAFMNDPECTVPTGLDYVKEDIDSMGNSLQQQSQKVLSNILRRGRNGLLVDYPRMEGVISRAEKARLAIRASTVSINAHQITNWRVEQIGGQHKLTLLVFKEKDSEIDNFAEKAIVQYRVLRLFDGVYSVELWRKSNDPKEGWILHDEYIPLDGAGKTWGEIPFTFVGSENNDHEVDPPPLLDLARLNIAHYRNSADYEDSVFFVGQVQPWITGLDEAWRDWLVEQGMYIGSRTPITLPVGASFGMEQAQPNMIAKEAMDAKEQQMVAIGAHMIEKGSALKTATQQKSEDAVAHSVVSLCAENVSNAYTQCLKWMARFENIEVPDNMAFALNQDYTSLSAEPQMIMAIVDGWQKGAYAKSDARAYLRKLAVIERDDEAIEDELENETPGLPLDNE